MTKTHWLEILEELKAMRSTNKFKSPLFYQEYGGTPKAIETINVVHGYLLLKEREFWTHADVIDISPNLFRTRFFFKQRVFLIKDISFK